ncbi:MAG: hypothetical protein HY046_13855 [Acidobacteria bacterium]|nr:hypothetical protein [Acidobacteriota bacterium]
MYDSLHCLSTAGTSGSTGYPQWVLSWTYDRYGNRSAQSMTAGSGPSNSVTIDANTNRVSAMGGYTFYYDSNGNLTQDDLYKYKYDAENRMVELRDLSNTLLATYSYDGKSLRVNKVVGADRTWFVYAGTTMIQEYEDAASQTYTTGTQAGTAPGDNASTLLYQHGDTLTTRLTTDNSGQLSNEQAHYPFGEQWYATGTADPSVDRKFTTYLKDTEAATGKLNYAVFREHSGRIGRFSMADPVQSGTGSPQRLNRYAYAVGDPVNRSDPRGLSDTGDPNNPNWVALMDSATGGIGGDYPVLFGGTKLGSWISLGIGAHGLGFGGSGIGGGGCGSSLLPPGNGFLGGGSTGGGGWGWPTLPGIGCAVPAGQSCFANLRSRSGVFGLPTGKRHMWWHVKDSTGMESIISGDGSTEPGKLNVYWAAGTQSNVNADSDTAGQDYWESTKSQNHCQGVNDMVRAAKTFPNGTVPYSPFGPNSNSIASCMARIGKFDVRPTPDDFVFLGWAFPVAAGACATLLR